MLSLGNNLHKIGLWAWNCYDDEINLKSPCVVWPFKRWYPSYLHAGAKAKGVSNHHQLVLGISFFFACPLLFFGRCHNLAIMLSWNDPFLLDFLIVDDSIVVGNGFIMLWLMPAKRERERRSNKKCTSAENEIFQMHFLWDFFGVCRNSFFSPLYKWFCKWSIYTVCNPFRLPVLINYIKNSKVQKRGCKLAFSSFQKILFMKRFFSHAT